VSHRSQKARSQEQSSGWSTMLHSTVTWIALLMLLLGLWLPMLSIQSNDPFHNNFISETWKKDLFLCRNYIINEFKIDHTNNQYLQLNGYIDEDNKHNKNSALYKVTSPTRNQSQVRHGLRIMMPSWVRASRNLMKPK
jgi:hypothetical protein